MKILIDADACPVTHIVERTAAEKGIEVLIICDTSHYFQSRYSRVITVENGSDAADFALVNHTRAGDLVVTQDYGVAAMVLGKGAAAIHQSGKWYTDENIDGMLMGRHIAGRARRLGKHHGKGPAKRTREDDVRFEVSFRELLDRCIERNQG